MATRQGRVLSRTAHIDKGGEFIVFASAYRPPLEPNYWLELAFADGDAAIAEVAGRLGPLTGAQAGRDSLFDWRGVREAARSVLTALLESRPDIRDAVTDEGLIARLAFPEEEGWRSLPEAATKLVKLGEVVISSLKPLIFDGRRPEGSVYAQALNEAMDANGIAACAVCGTVFTYTTRSRQYCSPACRKAAAVAGK